MYSVYAYIHVYNGYSTFFLNIVFNIYAYLSINDAKGCTTKLDPIIIKRSACTKSRSASTWKRSGNISPKKTMSGFTTPSLHSSHFGIIPSRIFSVI